MRASLGHMVLLIMLLGATAAIPLAGLLLFKTAGSITQLEPANWGNSDNIDQAISQFDAFRGAWSGDHKPWDGNNRLGAFDTNGGL